MLLDQIAGRLRARSPRLLATAIVFELAGSSAILGLWPRGWALGLILVMTAALRVYSLAERTKDSVTGPVAAFYALVRWLAAFTSLAAVVLLVGGLLRVVIGSGWV